MIITNSTKCWIVLVMGLIFLGIGGFEREAGIALISLGIGHLLNIINIREKSNNQEAKGNKKWKIKVN